MIDQLRLMSLLGGGNGVGTNIATPDMPGAIGQPYSEDDQDTDTLKEIFAPTNNAQGQLEQMLSAMPTRDQYKAGKVKRILAGLATLGTDDPAKKMEVGQTILNGDYNKAIGDWEMKLKPLAELASAERATNTNNRLIGSQVLSDRKATRALGEKAREADLRDQNADEDRKIRQQRADVYDFKSKNPLYKSVVDEDGMLVLWNPADPSKVVKTDINTGKMSDMDKVNLQIEGRLKEIQAQAANASTLEDKKAGNRQTLKSTPSGTPAARRTNTPAQDKIGLMNKYNQIISEYPELAKYFKVDAGNVTVKPLGGWMSGDVEADRNRAYNLLFGNKGPADDGKVLVEKDGKKFRLPKSQLKDALTQGYKESK